MNYKKIYDSIIERFKNSVISENVYVENHHIHPKCLGGSEDETNKVYLPARIHCLVHLLLVKLYPDIPEITYAAHLMYNEHRSCRKYAWLRKRCAKFQSELWKGMNHPFFGKRHTLETRRKIGLSVTGEKNGFFGKHHTEETLKKQSERKVKDLNPFFGKNHSVSTRQKMSDSLKGRKLSDVHVQKLKDRKLSVEWRMKISISRKNRNLQLKEQIIKGVNS